jgi:transaldolase
MKATKLLDNLGPAIWLDNIARDLLASRMVQRYIDEFSVTGLTTNPFVKSWNELMAVIDSKSAVLGKAS